MKILWLSADWYGFQTWLLNFVVSFVLVKVSLTVSLWQNIASFYTLLSDSNCVSTTFWKFDSLFEQSKVNVKTKASEMVDSFYWGFPDWSFPSIQAHLRRTYFFPASGKSRKELFRSQFVLLHRFFVAIRNLILMFIFFKVETLGDTISSADNFNQSENNQL